MSQLQLTGERQIATDVDLISNDHRKRYEFAAEFIENELRLGELSNILDAACGNGYGSYILAAGNGAVVTGVDISQDAIDCARENYGVGTLTEYRKIDFVAEDLPGEEYDCIVCFETLHSLHDPEALLKKFAVLSDTLICSVPNQDMLPYEHAKFPFNFRHYTVEQLDELLRGAGWQPLGWFTQYSKEDGELFEADDGRTLIVHAERWVG